MHRSWQLSLRSDNADRTVSLITGANIDITNSSAVYFYYAPIYLAAIVVCAIKRRDTLVGLWIV